MMVMMMMMMMMMMGVQVLLFLLSDCSLLEIFQYIYTKVYTGALKYLNLLKLHMLN